MGHLRPVASELRVQKVVGAQQQQQQLLLILTMQAWAATASLACEILSAMMGA